MMQASLLRCSPILALAALALLLGALSLFPAAPAQAQQAAPTGLTLTPGNGKIVVTWTAPSGAFLSYSLHFTTASPDDVADNAARTTGVDPANGWISMVFPIGASDTTATRTGLTNGQSYRVRLRTIVPNSAWVHGTATPAEATVPQGVDVRKHPTVTTSLSVRWDRVAHATGYNVRWRTKSPQGTPSSEDSLETTIGTLTNPYNIESLVSGTEYEVSVLSSVGTDDSAWSDWVSATPGNDPGTIWSATFTPLSVPAVQGVGCINRTQCDSALSDNSITVGADTFNIRYLGNSDTTGEMNLRMQQASTAALRALNFCSGTVSVPMNDTGTYVIDRRQHVRMGWAVGVPAEVRIGSSCAIPARPAAPPGLGATPGDSKLDVAWAEPSEGVTSYDVHYTSSSTVADDAAVGTTVATEWVDAGHSGTAASQTISSLNNGTPYRVRVRGVNAEGNGAWAHTTGTPRSSDADLSGLTASSATGAAATFTSFTLSPAFAAATTSYTGSVANDQTHAKLTPTVADSSATVKAGKQGTTLATVGSGNASSAISLDEGSNTITVRVIAQDSTTKDYTVTITRQSGGGPVVSEATVSLSLARYPVPEGEDAVVKATLSGRLSSDVAIPTYIRSVTAESSDYGSAPTITIPAGQLVGTGTITTSHDADGSHELFRVVLDRDSLPPSVREGKPNSVPVRILDDEWRSPFTVSLSATPGTVQEGGDVTVTATLHIRGQKSPVPSSYTDGMTIPLRVDRVISEEGDHGTLDSIVIPRLENSASVTIWTARDSDGDDETFTVSLGVLPKFRSPRAGCTTGVRVTISERAVDPGSGAAQTMGECKYPEDAPDTEPFVPRQGDDSRYFALSRLEVCYDVEASGDFAACSLATLAGYGYRVLIPGSATHAKIRPTTTNSGAQVKVRKVTYQNGVRTGTAWGSLSAVPRGELSAAFTVVKTSPNTYAEVRINDGGRYTTYFLVIDPPLEESGEPDTQEEQSPQEKYADLITKIKEWRDDPCCASDKAHTDRWDRTLLTFGEPVSDATLSPMTADEAQGYVDQGWTRWVEVVAALRELDAAAQQTPPSQAPPVSSAIADVSGLEVDATQDVSLSGVFSDAGNDALTITAASSDETIATVTVASDGSALTLTGVSEGTATITVTAQDGDGNTVSDTFAVPVARKYTGLIAQIKEWRDDPCCASDKAHTDRWNRTLLTFGETVADTSLTVMTATEAQTYADRGWTRWVEVVKALEELENQAPTVSSAIADATIISESGTQTVSLSGVFSDADNDALTITAASSDESVATVSVAADQSTLTVTAYSRGSATITVTANDGKGGPESDGFTVRIKAAPVVASALSNVSLEAGATQDVSLSGVFSDADGDALTITAASSDEAKATATVAADRSKLTVAGVAQGTATITVTAQDSDGNTASDAFDVSVGQANRAPTVSSAITDATIVNESGTQEVSLSGVFSDADSDSLTIAATSGDEAVATVSVAAGYATLTVSAQARGEAEITVTAADGNGGTVSDEFTVSVKAAPVVASAISDVSGLEVDAARDVSLSGVFSDADGDSLTITAASSDGAKATVTVAADGSALTLTGVAEGAATITVTARDTDGNTVSDDFAVSVEPKAEDDPPPDGDSPTGAPTVVSPLEDISLEGPELREIDLSGVFQDPDGDALTFSAASSNYGVATILPVEGSTLTLMGTGTGTATITVTAEDSDGNQVSDAFEVTVTPASQEG